MVTTYGREPDLSVRLRCSHGRNVRQARRLAGLTHTELAALIGVTPGAVSQWETGRTSPRVSHQVRIAAALNVPHSLLFPLDVEAATLGGAR